MPDSKISALSAQTTVAPTDMFVLATAGGATRKITGANLQAANRPSRYAAATVTTPVDVANTVTETALASFSLAAGDLGTTGVLRLVMAGDRLYNNVITETLRIRLKLGATTILDFGGSVPQSALSAARMPWKWIIEIANLGAASSQWCEWIVFSTDTSLNQNVGIGGFVGDNQARRMGGALMTASAASAVDTTSSQTVAVTAEWSVASANNSMRLQHSYAELL